MKIGILTGGGDAPGLNAVIYGALLQAAKTGNQVIGIKKGWEFFAIEKSKIDQKTIERYTVELNVANLDDLHIQGGTILYSSRTNPFKDVSKAKTPEEKTAIKKKVADDLTEKMKMLGLDALIAIGGDDTCGVAAAMYEYAKANIVCCPKTIDNDLNGTNYTFGFFTGAQLASNMMDNLVTTAKSHQRIFVVEVMGRDAGWLTLYSGLSSGAAVILLPEKNFSLEKDIIDPIIERAKVGYEYHIIALAEGAQPTPESLKNEFKTVSPEFLAGLKKDAFGNPILAGVISKVIIDELNKSEKLKKALKDEGFPVEVRDVVLGHNMRAGTPTVFDRVLGMRYGLKAMKCVEAGDFGKMMSLQGTEIVTVPVIEGSKKKYVPLDSDLMELKDLLCSQKYLAKKKK